MSDGRPRPWHYCTFKVPSTSMNLLFYPKYIGREPNLKRVHILHNLINAQDGRHILLSAAIYWDLVSAP